MTFYCNDVASASSQWDNGTEIGRESIYYIYCEGVNTDDYTIMVSFLDGNGQYSTVPDYNDHYAEVWEKWASNDWVGPFYNDKVESGFYSTNDSGQYSSTDYVQDFDLVFADVPSSVVGIKVEFLDIGNGSVWHTFCWSCGEPATLTPPGSPTLSINGSNIVVQWTPAVASNTTDEVTYKLVWGNQSGGYGANITSCGTSLSATVPFSLHEERYGFIVVAYCGNLEAESARAYVTTPPDVDLSAPGTPSLIVSGRKIHVSWTAAIGSNGTGNVTYTLVWGSQTQGYSAVRTSCGTALSVSVDYDEHETQYGFLVEASYSGATVQSARAYITTPADGNVVKIWSGSSWADYIALKWTGAAWEEQSFSAWSSNSWQELSH